MTPIGPEYSYVEKPSMELLGQLGWAQIDAFQETLGPQGTLGRDSQHDVVLTHRLRFAMRKLNDAQVPDTSINEAIEVLTKDRSVMNQVRANREVYDLLRDGYRAEWTDDHGEKRTETLRYLDLKNPSDNDLLAVQQMWVKGHLHSRRLDAALFVNGVPLVLMEFKEPGVALKSAYDDNVTDYRDTIPQLFIPNCFVLLSNGSEAKVGATYSPWEFFGDWKVIDAAGTRGAVALETALRGTCDPAILLDLFENFVAYLERPGGLIKNVARSHQYLGVNAAIENLRRARAEQDKRLGVFWHTQGSGKSLSMLWFTQKVLRQIAGKWTFVMVTDRTELDTQLHGEFADAGAVPPEARVHAASIAHLRELLAADHRYVFTLIQKFQPSKAAGEREMPVLSERSDIIVITDSSHPVKPMGGERIIELDQPARIEAELSADLAADRNHASAFARQRLSTGRSDLQRRIVQAYQGVADAWSLGIAKSPAGGVDRRYVVYGEPDVARAITRIHAHQTVDRSTRP